MPSQLRRGPEPNGGNPPERRRLYSCTIDRKSTTDQVRFFWKARISCAESDALTSIASRAINAEGRDDVPAEQTTDGAHKAVGPIEANFPA